MSYCGWLRNPAPVDRWFIPLFIGFQPSFWWCRISSIHSSFFDEMLFGKALLKWLTLVTPNEHMGTIHRAWNDMERLADTWLQVAIVRLQCWKWSGEQDTLGIQVIWDIMGQNAKPKQKMTGLTISNRHHCPVFGAGPHSHFDPQIHTGLVKGYSLRYSWTDDANLNKRLSMSEALELLSSCRSLIPAKTGPGMSHIRFIAVLFFSKSSIAIITVNQSCAVLVTLAMDLAARTYESSCKLAAIWGRRHDVRSIHSRFLAIKGMTIHSPDTLMWTTQRGP